VNSAKNKTEKQKKGNMKQKQNDMRANESSTVIQSWKEFNNRSVSLNNIIGLVIPGCPFYLFHFIIKCF